jgi:hypothetical protein
VRGATFRGIVRSAFNREVADFCVKLSDHTALAVVLWDEQIINANIRAAAVPFFTTSWRVLRRSPVLASVLFDNRGHMSLVEPVWNKWAIALPAAKLLAVFNHAYARVKGEERAFFSHATKSKALFDSYNLTRQGATNLLLRTTKPSSGPGKSGIFRFLGSLVTLEPAFAKEIAAVLREHARRESLINVYRPEKAFARFFCEIVVRTGESSMLVEELGKFDAACTIAIDFICHALCEIAVRTPDIWNSARAPLRDRLRTTKSASAFGPNVARAVIAGMDKRQAAEITAAARDLIDDEVKRAAKAGGVGGSKDGLARGIRFVTGVEEALKIERRKMSVSGHEIQVAAAALQAPDEDLAVDLIRFAGV